MNEPSSNLSPQDVTEPDHISSVRTRALEWIGGALLFTATALVVVWQNAHLAVLWDLSYVLDHSYRIALGEVPYRDFPFVHAPLTFLIQAAIIKLTGRVFWHATAYCAITGALGTLLTWRILRNVLRDVPHGRVISFLLALPLAPLGIYSVFPHPFYDPDCTLVLLISVLLLQQLDRRRSSIALPLLAGASLVMPLFAKQNTGLTFLIGAVVLICLLIMWSAARRERIRHLLLTMTGVIVALAIAIWLIHVTAGVKNYWHWTMQFAAQRRTPSRAEMIGIYADKMNLVWLGFVGAGTILLWRTRGAGRVWAVVAAVLMTAPFLWPAIYLLHEADASERADRLLAVWPVIIIASFLVAIPTIKRLPSVSPLMPFIVIGAINGCFMSQQLWGSTYAIWPLLMILLACLFAASASLGFQAARDSHLSATPDRRRRAISTFLLLATILVIVPLLIAGAAYLRSHERLSYANLDEGELTRSTLPQLKGLTTRGEWIPNFEELVRYAEEKIPRDEGIVLLPGEDPFYYVTGRRPQFPVLLFDQTVNPYTPEQIREICRDRNIRWLIVKQDLQNEDDAVDQQKDQIVTALEDDFEQVDSLKNYDIYKRSDSDKSENDDEPD